MKSKQIAKVLAFRNDKFLTSLTRCCGASHPRPGVLICFRMHKTQLLRVGRKRSSTRVQLNPRSFSKLAAEMNELRVLKKQKGFHFTSSAQASPRVTLGQRILKILRLSGTPGTKVALITFHHIYAFMPVNSIYK